MAKKWSDFTRREKMIGAVVTVFAVISISGIASAIKGDTAQIPEVKTNTQTSTPAVVYKNVEETEVIPFSKENRDDTSRSVGSSAITTSGVDGIKTKTYKMTYVDGIEKSRELIGEITTKEPINEITSVGTYVAPVKKVEASTASCSPNYSGACVPIASDVDCDGGSGNGPAYVSGPVYVVGSDIYKLDGNGDGVGCE